MKKKFLILLIVLVLLVIIIFFGYNFYTYINSVPKAVEVTGNEILNAITVENLQTVDLSPYIQWMFILLFFKYTYTKVNKLFQMLKTKILSLLLCITSHIHIIISIKIINII